MHSAYIPYPIKAKKKSFRSSQGDKVLTFFLQIS